MNENLLPAREWIEAPVSLTGTAPAGDRFDEPQPGSVLDYWRIICRRKFTLGLLAVAGLLVAALFTLPQAPVYRARASLEIQDVNQDFINMKLVSPVADSAPVDALSDIQTQVRIMRSDTLIELALDKLKISSVTALNPHKSHLAGWRRILNLPEPTQSRDDLIQATAKNLKVDVTTPTRIIDIAFDSTDRNLAARFANALVSEFIEQNMQARWQMSQHTSEWLAQQLEDLRLKLRRSEDGLQAYARQNKLIYTADKQNVSEEKLRQLQAELSKAETDRVARQSRFEISRSSAADTLPDVLNDSNLRTLATNLTDLRRREAELLATFRPDYSKAKVVRAEIAALESAIEQERVTIVSRINNEFEEAQHREKLLAAAYADQVRLVTQDSQKSIQYNILKREVDTNRQIYEAMLQRVKESSIASAMRASNIRIIDRARPPERPYKPNLPVNCAVGLLCGAVLGVAVVVTRGRADRSLHEPGDAHLWLGLPELGVIPASRNGRRVQPAVVTLLPKEGDLLTKAGAQLFVSQSGPSIAADSFRAVLASIIFSAAREQPRVLVITSAGPGEGKTTASANLAMSLARINRKVLLVDGDIRSPRMHDIFDLDNSKGVTTLLGQSRIDESLVDASIQGPVFPNLYVLTSGPALQAGNDLLFSASMPGLIARYKKQFDMVVIDTPPMLSMPDARVLGRTSDGVILIARAGRTTRDAILAAFRRLVQDRTPVLGIVLNDWKAGASPYNTYYGAYRDRYANAAGAGA